MARQKAEYMVVSPCFHHRTIVGFNDGVWDRKRIAETRFSAVIRGLPEALAVFHNRVGRFLGCTGTALQVKGAANVLDGTRRSLDTSEYIVAHMPDGDPLADAMIWIRRV